MSALEPAVSMSQEALFLNQGRVIEALMSQSELSFEELSYDDALQILKAGYEYFEFTEELPSAAVFALAAQHLIEINEKKNKTSIALRRRSIPATGECFQQLTCCVQSNPWLFSHRIN